MKFRSLFLTLFATVGTLSAQSLLPMNVVKQKFPDDKFALFIETREHPIQYNDSIRQSWLNENPKLNASQGEIYIYQIALCATEDLSDVKVAFTPLKSNNSTIPSSDIVCYNISGVDIMGKPFMNKLSVPKNKLQTLLIGVDMKDAKEGEYSGNVEVSANGVKKILPIVISVDDKVVENHGYNEGWRMSRLNWLNSTIAQDYNITKGYQPVTRNLNTISILGRDVVVGMDGLPSQINTYFSESNQSLNENSQPILSSPMSFVVETETGKETFKPSGIKYESQGDAEVSWTLSSKSKNFELKTYARMEFDGFVRYELTLKAKKDCNLNDIRLETAFSKEKAKYKMGLGVEGGIRKEDVCWKWDTTNNQDMLWVGGINGGLRFKWMDENYRRPLVNVYYHYGPLLEPKSWSNSGNGGVNLNERNQEGDVLLNAYSGKRSMKAGEELHYNFEILITPFRTIRKNVMFGDRYFHGGGTDERSKVSQATAAGANIINVHHASDLYPFINYPFLDENLNSLKEIVSDAHANGKRMKFYYTTRELTKNLPEFWSLYSLNGEVIFPGPGNSAKSVVNPNGPNAWLVKNLREKYIAAWYAHIDRGIFKGEVDLSVITTPDSRLNNFYIGGLDFMVQKMGADGVYIDDSALDRYTIRRARKVIDAYRPEGRMDLHSWNHLCDAAGNASCLNMYMDLLPYFDICWIGEGRNYNHPQDNWLVEVSGIPFGITGQMLEGGGNLWRGMVYGITNRPGWSTIINTTPIWNFWDKYSIQDKEMIGYWDEKSPVKTDNPNVSATIYKGDKQSIISIAAWGNEDQTVNVKIDFPYVKVYQPAIEMFQDEADVDLSKPLTIPKGKGFLFVIEN